MHNFPEVLISELKRTYEAALTVVIFCSIICRMGEPQLDTFSYSRMDKHLYYRIILHRKQYQPHGLSCSRSWTSQNCVARVSTQAVAVHNTTSPVFEELLGTLPMRDLVLMRSAVNSAS